MNILIIDTETTGLSPKTNNLIEICAILYSLKHKEIVQIYSTLFPTATNEAFHINKIDPELTQVTYVTELAKAFLYDMGDLLIKPILFYLLKEVSLF